MSVRRLPTVSDQGATEPFQTRDASRNVSHNGGPLDEFLADRQTADASLMFNKDVGMKARVDISNGGLLSVAALVSGFLLATSVLVHVAVRDGKRPWWRT
ncbi:hypothetical protein ASF70_12905 [Rhizobium sp. Leaf321]|nr:hypothetical protein ASF70_12905 [Rhizobium sp. Leaf321]